MKTLSLVALIALGSQFFPSSLNLSSATSASEVSAEKITAGLAFEVSFLSCSASCTVVSKWWEGETPMATIDCGGEMVTGEIIDEQACICMNPPYHCKVVDVYDGYSTYVSWDDDEN